MTNYISNLSSDSGIYEDIPTTITSGTKKQLSIYTTPTDGYLEFATSPISGNAYAYILAGGSFAQGYMGGLSESLLLYCRVSQGASVDLYTNYASTPSFSRVRFHYSVGAAKALGLMD